MASRRPSPHASPRQIGTIASIPESLASVASAAPWFVSSGARRYTLSPSMARLGAVEQQLSRSMLFSSEYPLMLRMLELVSGPITIETPRALRAVSFSRATTGLVCESSSTRRSDQPASFSARYSLKSITPRRVPSMFSSPCVARSPVSGSIEPMLTSPDRAGAPSGITATSSSGITASSSIEFTAAVTPTAMATATPMPIIAMWLPFNARPADGGFKSIMAAVRGARGTFHDRFCQ